MPAGKQRIVQAIKSLRDTGNGEALKARCSELGVDPDALEDVARGTMGDVMGTVFMAGFMAGAEVVTTPEVAPTWDDLPAKPSDPELPAKEAA